MTAKNTNVKTAVAEGGKATGKPNRKNRVTKKDQLVRLLGRKGGIDIASISEKLGWQQHTTRAALTGLRKSGFEIVSDRSVGVRASRYRVIAEPKGDAI